MFVPIMINSPSGEYDTGSIEARDSTMSRHPRRQLHPDDAVKLSDVAFAAGVSTATVSRAINQPEKVRPEVLKRVRFSVEELGYVPHGAARALASQRSYTIGTVIPTFNNAIFAQAIDALQHRLSENGFTLFLATSDYDPEKNTSAARRLIERGIDGMMLIGEEQDASIFKMLDAKKLPYVVVWSYCPATVRPCIGFDNLQSAHRITSYLLDIGHKRVGMIAGLSLNNDRAAARIAGVKSALAERGLVLPRELLFERPYEIDEGRRALHLLFDRPDPPTAIVCGNDVLAFGALFEAKVLGISVPQDLSVVGFDDLPLARHIDPPLTTMHVPSAEMGRRAADYLLERLGGETPSPSTELDVRLIVRSSTAPPPVRL